MQGYGVYIGMVFISRPKWNVGSVTVWPDVVIKSTPNLSENCLKTSQRSLTWKFKISPNCLHSFGLLLLDNLSSRNVKKLANLVILVAYHKCNLHQSANELFCRQRLIDHRQSIKALRLFESIFCKNESYLTGTISMKRWRSESESEREREQLELFFKKWANPSHFFIYFCLFKQTLQFLQQINVKIVHPVYRAGIWTHNLWNKSLLP